MIEPAERCGRIEHEAAATPGIANKLQCAIRVTTGFRMKTDVTGARGRKVLDQPIHRSDHKVDIDRCGNPVFSKGLTNHWPNGQIRNVMVVHHIEMDQVCAGLEHGIHLLTKPRKIGRQN